MSSNWRHIKTVIDGEKFEINGLNIWDYQWYQTGERITVKDHLYGQNHMMQVFEIKKDKTVVRFAAGEFSNCVWGIYQEQQN